MTSFKRRATKAPRFSRKGGFFPYYLRFPVNWRGHAGKHRSVRLWYRPFVAATPNNGRHFRLSRSSGRSETVRSGNTFDPLNWVREGIRASTVAAMSKGWEDSQPAARSMLKALCGGGA